MDGGWGLKSVFANYLTIKLTVGQKIEGEILIFHVYIYAYIWVYAYIYTYIWLYVYYVYIGTCKLGYMYKCVYVYIHRDFYLRKLNLLYRSCQNLYYIFKIHMTVLWKLRNNQIKLIAIISLIS